MSVEATNMTAEVRADGFCSAFDRYIARVTSPDWKNPDDGRVPMRGISRLLSEAFH